MAGPAAVWSAGLGRLNGEVDDPPKRGFVVVVVAELLLVFGPKGLAAPKIFVVEGVDVVPAAPSILPAVPDAVVDVLALPNKLPPAEAGVVDVAGLGPPNTNAFC